MILEQAHERSLTSSPSLRVCVCASPRSNLGVGRAVSDLLVAGARVHLFDVSDQFLADFHSARRGATCAKRMSPQRWKDAPAVRRRRGFV